MLAARVLFVVMAALKLWQFRSRMQQVHWRRQLERCWAL